MPRYTRHKNQVKFDPDTESKSPQKNQVSSDSDAEIKSRLIPHIETKSVSTTHSKTKSFWL